MIICSDNHDPRKYSPQEALWIKADITFEGLRQIVYCHMDKTTHEIKYKSGAIEEPEIRKCVVDVLEGTYPAFDLRKKKYFSLG